MIFNKFAVYPSFDFSHSIPYNLSHYILVAGLSNAAPIIIAATHINRIITTATHPPAAMTAAKPLTDAMVALTEATVARTAAFAPATAAFAADLAA